jgi:dCTP deaminase
MSAGVLSLDQLKKLVTPTDRTTSKLWSSAPDFEKGFDQSALDLPLGDKFWEMTGSCRAGKGYKVLDLIRRYGTSKTLAGGSTTLRRGQVYVFEADCGLDLRGTGIEGRATGKSSIGRLDCLVRLLVDESGTYDFIERDKKLDTLYVEVTPISFDLDVRRGTALSQLRLYKGRENDISLTRGELIHEDDTFPVVDDNGLPLKGPCEEHSDEIWFPFSLDLRPDRIAKCSAFAVRKDLPSFRIDPSETKRYDPKKYWEPITWKDEAIELEPGRLYILRSKERLRIPAHLALECKSYTTEMGEWRIEYAGFAHPYFGTQRKQGSPIIFEVRGHNVPTILTHGIPLGNVRFLRMSQTSELKKKKTPYERQELALSKCFKSWAA